MRPPGSLTGRFRRNLKKKKSKLPSVALRVDSKSWLWIFAKSFSGGRGNVWKREGQAGEVECFILPVMRVLRRHQAQTTGSSPCQHIQFEPPSPSKKKAEKCCLTRLCLVRKQKLVSAVPRCAQQKQVLEEVVLFSFFFFFGTVL